VNEPWRRSCASCARRPVRARVLGLLGVLENLFTYEGDPWHEIVFVFEVELEDRVLYEHDELEVRETIDDLDQQVGAIWVDPDALDAPLYPDGLARLLAERAS
jgi:hypothetical protein